MGDLKRILHVDDKEDLRDVVAMTIETLGGHSVESCSPGSEALQRVKSVAPDLILLDVMMPGMAGFTTLKFLRRDPETAGIPVVFMPAKIQTAGDSEYTGAGTLGCSQSHARFKPFATGSRKSGRPPTTRRDRGPGIAAAAVYWSASRSLKPSAANSRCMCSGSAASRVNGCWPGRGTTTLRAWSAR